jgi:hypothetical protein
MFFSQKAVRPPFKWWVDTTILNTRLTSIIHDIYVALTLF